MDTKSKSINKKTSKYILYCIIAILISTSLLSVLEVRRNWRYITPRGRIIDTEIGYSIDEFAQKAMDFAIYYKDENYVSNKDNITEDDIKICKIEIQDRIESELIEFKDNQYRYDSFHQLSYEAQQKKFDDERKKLEEKYTFTDEELAEYVLVRKKNSFKSLQGELASYRNLKFMAYDKINDKWIGNTENKDIDSIIKNSRFFSQREVKSTTNKENNKVFIDGKEIENVNSFNLNYNYDYSYNDYDFFGEKDSIYVDYKYENNDDYNNVDIMLYTWIPSKILKGDYIYTAYQEINNNVNRLIFVGIVSLISTILATILIKKSIKNNLGEEIINEKVKMLRKYPVEYKVAVALAIIIIGRMYCHPYYFYNYVRWLTIGNTIYTTVTCLILYVITRILYLDYKEGTLLKNNISKKLKDEFLVLMKNGSIFRSIVLMLLAYGVIGGALLFLAVVFYDLFPIFFVIGIVVTIALMVIGMKRIAYLEKIMEGAKDGAEGRLTYKIEEKGQGRFTDLAHNINNIKEGLRESIKNEVKSEKMKTELITNVSHDLKTPLTSIINYVELLKRENIEPEEARDYVRVLDMKAQRLKILIDDLFEASKAASGAMELNIEKIEVVQLLKQALGENDERIKEQGLDLRLNISEEKAYIQGDGKRLYRVFENLISNAVKYSLLNTRVYIDVIKEENEIKITMKNIAAYELNFDVNEITERFRRADEARTSEGSGLGLAIAKSIVELHGGNFDIEIDGDLFKAIITLK